jgi:hypothetical protein
MTYGADTFAALPFASFPESATSVVATLFTLVSAEVESEQTVLVRFSEPPMQARYLAPGSARVPSYWSITGGSVNPRVLAIETTDELTVVRLCLSRALEPVQYTIVATAPSIGADGTTGIWSAVGRPLDSSSRTVYCVGVIAPALEARQATDLYSSPTGAVEMSNSGDYARGTVVDYARKRILRILSYRPGSLKYAPDYGVGLIEKRQYRESELPALKRQIAAAVSREQDMTVTNVQITLSEGMLTCVVTVRLRAGTTVSATYQQGRT